MFQSQDRVAVDGLHLGDDDPVLAEPLPVPGFREPMRIHPDQRAQRVHVGPVTDLRVQAGVLVVPGLLAEESGNLAGTLGDLAVDTVELFGQVLRLEDERGTVLRCALMRPLSPVS